MVNKDKMIELLAERLEVRTCFLQDLIDEYDINVPDMRFMDKKKWIQWARDMSDILEEDNEVNDRLDRIKKYREDKQLKEDMEKREREQRINGYIKQIYSLESRFDELMAVANEFLKAGGEVTNSYGRNWDAGDFVTDGVYHSVGFLYGWNIKKVVGFGKQGGGVCDYNLEITPSEAGGYKVCVDGRDQEYVLKAFLDNFDDFESAFYDYVDKKIGEFYND